MDDAQEGSVFDYCSVFQSLFERVKNSEDMSEVYAIYLFIDGLEPRIRELFITWHQYSYHKVKDFISLALKIDANKMQDSFSPFDPSSSFYNKDLKFDTNITLEELMKDNELFQNGKIQETCDNIVQETIVDEAFVEMCEENSEVELVCPDVGCESEHLNQTKVMNESTYVGIFDEEKMSRIKGHHTYPVNEKGMEAYEMAKNQVNLLAIFDSYKGFKKVVGQSVNIHSGVGISETKEVLGESIPSGFENKPQEISNSKVSETLPLLLQQNENMKVLNSIRSMDQMSGLGDVECYLTSTPIPIHTTVDKTKPVSLVLSGILLDVNGLDKERLMGFTVKLKQLDDGKQSKSNIQLAGTRKSNQTNKNDKSFQVITDDRQLGAYGIDAINPLRLTKMLLDEIGRDIHTEDQGWKLMLLRYFDFVKVHENGKLDKLLLKKKKEGAKRWLIKWKWKNDIENFKELQELQLQKHQIRLQSKEIIEKNVVEIIEFLLLTQKTDARVRTKEKGRLRQQISAPLELSKEDKPKVSHRLAGINSLIFEMQLNLVFQSAYFDIWKVPCLSDIVFGTLSYEAYILYGLGWLNGIDMIKSRFLIMNDVFVCSTFWVPLIWCIWSWSWSWSWNKITILATLIEMHVIARNINVIVWVWDPGSIIQILVRGLLRTKVFEGERLSRGGGDGVWSIYHERFSGYCSLDPLLVIGNIV